jgi:hypothetical protein
VALAAAEPAATELAPPQPPVRKPSRRVPFGFVVMLVLAFVFCFIIVASNLIQFNGPKDTDISAKFWKEFRPRGENFWISFPGAPVTKDHPNDLSTKRFVAEYNQGEIVFTLAYFNLSKEESLSMSALTRTEMDIDYLRRTHPGCVVAKKTQMEHQGNPGVDFAITYGEGGRVLLGRRILTDNRFYRLDVEGKDLTFETTAVRSFLESFTLTAPAKPRPEKREKGEKGEKLNEGK